MLRMPAIFFYLLISFSTSAQMTIKGTVTDGVTGTAIPGCSVFISGSSKGTVSASNGSFELAGVPAGKKELVVSSVGYETLVYPFSDAQLPLKLAVKLQTKAKEMQNVVLEPFVEEGWDKWGRVFTENFIGTTPNAYKCRIRNTKTIRFRYYKKSNRLVALADEPLLVENKALGYLIKYQLEEFEINFSQRSTFFLGYPLYEEIALKEKKREEAYKGSVMHFMRALYANRLIEEGFEVKRMQRIPNTEKERVRALYRRNIQTQAGDSKVITVGPGSTTGDSADYYRRVMSQPDYRDSYGISLLGADSLVVASNDELKQIWFENYIAITYKGALEDAEYVKKEYPPRKPWYQRSLVMLNEGNAVTIDQTGNYYNPQDFFTSWYWAWSEKIANSLPSDYQPAGL